VFFELMKGASDADLGALRSEVRAHLASFESKAARNGLLPVDIARELAAGLETLLATAPSLEADQRDLVVAAARYFVSEEDVRPDTEGVLGLDDDVQVFNHVARRLGRPELELEL
jgi:hypothetical protein